MNGITSLNAGAPNLRLTGDQTQRGTYTQRRRTQMAGGGITQIGKPGGLVESGISKYGALDFITKPLKKLKDKIVDDIIPNEIKDSPVGAALVGGALVNQFGIPFTGTAGDRMGQNWLGNLLGGVMPGDTQFNTVLGDNLPFSYQDITSSQYPIGGVDQIMKDALAKDMTGIAGAYKNIFDTGAITQTPGNILSNVPYMDRIMDIAQNRTPQGIKDAAFQYAKDVAGQNKYLDYARNFGETFLGDTTRDGSTFNWKTPVAAGLAAGAYTASQPRDTLPMDETGIKFQTAQEAMADPKLRFKPRLEDTQLAAQGGRIGYRDAGEVDDSLYNQATVWDLFESEMGRSPENDDELRAWIKSKSYLEQDTIRQAQFAEGKPPTKYKRFPTSSVLLKERSEQYKDYLDRAGEYVSAHGGIGGAAQGGRIGAQEGGLMDLGGMEKDYRQEGGFVPIGGQEKADDVPARLSKNEFVFTADAVRAAGGGNIDKGAEIMENLMENLEAGGKVSEESQGLEGARGMFANAQQLEKRII